MNPESEPPSCTEVQTVRHIVDIMADMAQLVAKLTVTPLKKNDIGEIVELLHASGPSVRPRDRSYIRTHAGEFVCIKDGDTVVACGEIITLDNKTLELGALATRDEYRGLGLSAKIIEHGETIAESEKRNLILVTDNETLIQQLIKRKYIEGSPLYEKRIQQSPGKKLYLKLFRGE